MKLAFALLFVPLAAVAQDWAPNITVAATWQDNATNASRASDEIGALLLRADLATARRFSPARDDSLILEGRVAVEAWPRFDGLNRAEFGAATTWRHKFGLGAQAPVFSVELAASATAAHESARAGLAGGATLAWQQRFSESTRVKISHELSRYDARAAVFDRTAGETALEVTQSLNERWLLAFTARARHGDVVSYATPPRPDIVALAKVRTANTTFDRPLVVYSLTARTLGGSLALTRTLDERTALSFSYEYRETEKDALRYVNHLVSTVLVRQF